MTLEPSPSLVCCPPHPAYVFDMCVRCGAEHEEEADEGELKLRYIHRTFHVSLQEAGRITRRDLPQMLSRRKAYLVLDIDLTLLQSVSFSEVSAAEGRHLRAGATMGGLLYHLPQLGMWTKLRPFVHTFLQEASKLFQIHLYTMGERGYAQTIANILDPSGHLFGGRVISQNDSTCRTSKDLDVLLGAESAAIIVDDTEAVWPRHKGNLVVVKRYLFFGSASHHASSTTLLQAGKDESESDGTLANTLKLLQRVHSAFFDGYYENAQGQTQAYEGEQDMQRILHTMRSTVLAGCKLVFSRIFPTSCQPETHPLWRLAEELGATCSISVDAGVTHVVAVDIGTDKARWAREQKRHLVHPAWVEAALHAWARPCEEDYSLTVDDVTAASMHPIKKQRRLLADSELPRRCKSTPTPWSASQQLSNLTA